MTLTLKQIKKIKELRNKGLSTYEIARKFKVAQSTICYHTEKTSKQRFSYKNRKEYLKKYQKEYSKKRYKEDEEFRKKKIENSRRYYNKNKKKTELAVKGGN
jgi:orotate phosphoribosyltransferase-like protein